LCEEVQRCPYDGSPPAAGMAGVQEVTRLAAKPGAEIVYTCAYACACACAGEMRAVPSGSMACRIGIGFARGLGADQDLGSDQAVKMLFARTAEVGQLGAGTLSRPRMEGP
jgi:hypothetical protein